ncbi:hypothetical protein KC318_g3983 [Hortaea werneckii]|uniref:FHA domain-containing protein n=1 Tax=Hortaea werneckii TaxID=91943 RepID=A0A3M7APH7_HORWE|nr:hypothetical protein KC334_g846 [Hortaea werneckii]KAI7017810.1 hypothetical protein KC355_g3551 [Hortaea werneckii]KAI7167897.1 hypothetical protein KC324_g11720 [Hortaea werneckii]KAI7593859.1 hypothetical protein KC316_g1476 [Hortaea werneckii]KAI7670530.1 hypothetical protein KC318_g3983 [Hortaea werneckii]
MSSALRSHPPPQRYSSNTSCAALMADLRREFMADDMHTHVASPSSTSLPPSSATRHVPVTLTPSADTSDLRHLSLADRIIIGRASRSEVKNLQASPTNALFDCPVVSRAHAVISFHPRREYDEQVTITDLKSMHGTAVNGQPLLSHAPHILRSGDTIKLGDRVVRGPDHHDGIQITFRRQPLPPILGAGTYAVPMDESASDAESTFSEQDNFSSAQTTPEQDKFRFGSQLQQFEQNPAGTLYRYDQQQYEPDPIPQVVKDTYAESDSDSLEDGSSSQVYDAHDSEDELDVSPSKIDIYNDLMSTMAQHPESDNELEDDDENGQDEHEYDDDEDDEHEFDDDHIDDDDHADDDYPDDFLEEYSTRLSPELGSAAVEETSTSQPAPPQVPLEPLLAPHFVPSYPFPGITRGFSNSADDAVSHIFKQLRPDENVPTPAAPEAVPPAPKGQISISDIVEDPAAKEAKAAPASIPPTPETNNTADKAGSTTTTGSKRKADALSQNDPAIAPGTPTSSPPPNTEQQQPPHLPTTTETETTQQESQNVVYIYEPTPPATKKAKKNHHHLSSSKQQQQQQKKKGKNISTQVAKYAGLYLAGGISAVAFLASPLAQRALDAL